METVNRDKLLIASAQMVLVFKIHIEGLTGDEVIKKINDLEKKSYLMNLNKGKFGKSIDEIYLMNDIQGNIINGFCLKEISE